MTSGLRRISIAMFASLLLLAFLPAAASAVPAGTITDLGGLDDLALIPRSGNAPSASFTVTGVASGAALIEIRVAAPNSSDRVFRSPVAADGAFSATGWIRVELVDHAVTIDAVAADGSRSKLDSFVRVVAGDVYVVQGQSNLTRGVASVQSPFTRTYGGMGRDVSVADYQTWGLAVPPDSAAAGRTSGPALQMASRLAEDTGVPVAVFNHAVGGRSVTFFARNDANPRDLTTNYGQLLTRLGEAGVGGRVKGAIYYQGESDQDQPDVHRTGVPDLIGDWVEDFPSLAHTYVIQVREGCRVGPDLSVRDLQRSFALDIADVSTISINHVPGFDGCHFSDAGYNTIGDLLFEQIGRDLYHQTRPGIDSPLPYFARLGQVPGEVELYFANPSDLASGGQANSFLLSTQASAVAAEAGPGMLSLTFTDPVAAGATLSNVSDGPVLWLSPAGRSMLGFESLTIASAGIEVPGRGPDTKRPSRPTGLGVSYDANCGASLTWGPASDNRGVTGYRIYRSDNGGAFLHNHTTSSLSYCDQGVAANHSYHYYLRAFDEAGNIGWRNGIRSITVPGALDTERPSTPRGLQSTAGVGTVTLTWQASTDNVGVTEYVIYDATDRTELARNTGLSATIGNLAAGEHQFFVKAVDAAGNTSWRTNVTSATL